MKTLLVCLLAVLVGSGCRATPETPVRSAASLDSAETEPPTPETGLVISFPRVAAAIRSGIRHGRADLLDRPNLAGDRSWLGRLYPDTYAPLWVNVAGKPTQAARDAIGTMQEATGEGLDSLDYSPARLAEAAAAIDSVENPDPAYVGGFDLALSTAFLRYVRHLHSGRIDPSRLGFPLRLPEDRHDVPAMIRTALADGTITQLVLSQQPPLVQYTRVKEALARYRGLADSISEPVPNVEATVKPGDAWTGVGSLQQRLALLGDLGTGEQSPSPAETAADSDEGVPLSGAPRRYEGALVDAVKRFQERHGLAADGVIGRGTVTALNVPIRRRVAQLQLALERLRWLPDLTGERFILVNIPTFQLWAWDSLGADETPSLTMHVIVGQKTLGTQTPVLAERMEYVIFRPYWNVPPGILQNEILPALEKNPDYLRRNDMEVVQGQGDDAKAVPLDDEAMDLLARGQLRVRQRPGPRNSLGLVKFMFPNDENVYLHGTPAEELFSRTRRDFSHGCVRVERPVELAEWVLQGLPEWDRTRIIEAMQGGKPTQVNLPRPVAVMLFYTTAIVGPDGNPLFYDDIYGHDEKLLQALADRSR